MAITLDAIDLPDDLVWGDEFGWSNVTQDVQKSLTGALIIQESVQTKGRIITIAGTQDSAWITKTTLDLILAKANVPDTIMTLLYHGESFNVMFSRSGNTSPVDAKSIIDYSNRDADCPYSVTLKFIEV